MTEGCPKRRANLTYEELSQENELMLVDERSGKVTVLNSTAAGVWLLCDGRRDLDDLTGLVCRAIPDATPAEVRGRVEQAVQFLGEQGLLE
jgi:hypothetical protein